MFLGIDWTQWLPAITATLIALTVLVGIRGLYQDHTKDGKLTRAGWGVVAAMVVLGILTFLSGLLDQRIAEQMERAEAAEREERFQRQMSALRGVTGSLSQLQGDMRGSIGAQRELFDVANRSLGVSAALQREQRDNTKSVLRRVFAEGNRISPERIAVSIDYSCLAPIDRRSYPTIEAVQVAIEGERGTELSLVSRVSTRVSDEIIFHDFLAELGRYETFEAWRNARVRIRITGGPMTLGTSPEDRAEVRAEEEELRRRGIEFLPVRCPMLVKLYLNGREMLEAFGYLERTSRFFYLLEFEDLRVDPRRLPRFAN